MARRKVKMQQVEITAYELMNRVAQDIKARPMNYYQSNWACDAKEAVADAVYHYNSDNPLMKKHIAAAEERAKEACGTAFCRAGWMAAHLVNPVGKTTDDWRALEAEDGDGGDSIYAVAHEVLRRAGVSDRAIGRLFDGCALEGAPGTQRYADAGARGVREFMAQWKDQLKAHKVLVWEEKREVRCGAA